MSGFFASAKQQIRVLHPKRLTLYLVLAGVAACNVPPEQPDQGGAGARAGARLWVDADQRPEVVDAAARLVAEIARSGVASDRVSDGRKAGLSAALLLGSLADADTVVTGRVTRIRRGRATGDGGQRPVEIVSMSVGEIVRGQPATPLEYWTWSDGSAVPPVGAEVLVGLRSPRPAAKSHMLWSRGAQFAVRNGALELPGLRLGTETVARSLSELEGGRP
jgi:hypothetical protein